MLLVALCAGSRPTSSSAQALPPDRYELRARLDPAANSVFGAATIAWTNRSPRPLTYLMFHLYANAFSDPRTVFMREHGDRLRDVRLERTGGIDVLGIHDAAGNDLLVHANRALVPDDATQMRVELPRPLAPGTSLRLQLSFRVRLPSIVARMGRSGDFFMIAQWFPKLAKLEPDGSWASFPYHGLGEFYADFADYDLSVELPRRYTLAAPGKPVSRVQRPGGMRLERYVLPHSLDVAWAAYPEFGVHHASAATTQIDVYSPRGHLALASTQARLLAAQLARLGRLLGPYPYGRLVLVLPPGRAFGAAGMEYPGLIVGWPVTAWTALNPAAQLVHALTTCHELAHQWFPIVVASNELATPMLDEGLAEWLGLDALRAQFGRAFFQRTLGLPLDLYDLTSTQLAGRNALPSSLRPAYQYDASQLAAAVYIRPALALEATARTWGSARLWAAMGRYAHDNRFGHPTPDALFAAFDHSYWPGFAREVLRPTLQAVRCDPWLRRWGACATRDRRNTTTNRTAVQAAASRWGPRLLLWAQTLLSLVGP